MDFSDKLYNAMNDAGIFIDGNIDWHSDQVQRFPILNYRNKKPHLFVILHRGGATFGDWRHQSGSIQVWEKDWKETTIFERKDRCIERDSFAKRKEMLMKKTVLSCARLVSEEAFSKNICKAATIDNAYAKIKRIIPYYGLQVRSYLIVRLTDINHNLQSLQYIKPHFKKWKKNTSIKNGMVWLSEKLSKDYSGPIWLCEGYATGCTIYQAMGAPVVCAMSASNLPGVALALKREFVFSQIKICADNDQFTKENIGLKEAENAAKLTNSNIYYPVFSYINVQTKPTDFNDLFCLNGIEEVQKQLGIRRN